MTSVAPSAAPIMTHVHGATMWDRPTGMAGDPVHVMHSADGFGMSTAIYVRAMHDSEPGTSGAGGYGRSTHMAPEGLTAGLWEFQ